MKIENIKLKKIKTKLQVMVNLNEFYGMIFFMINLVE